MSWDCDHEFNSLYKQSYDWLLRHAYRVTGNYHDSEELVDETFVVYMQKSKTQDIHNPQAYITGILSKLIGNYLKSKRRESSIFLPLNYLRDVTDPADGLRRSLSDLLPNELLPWEREILLLRYEKQLSFEEISSRLGLQPVSCRSRLFRAKLHFRLLVEDEENNENLQTDATFLER